MRALAPIVPLLSLALFLPGCKDEAAAARCYDVCGPGTACEDGQCVIPTAEEPEEPEDDAKGKKKKRRRRGSRKGHTVGGAEDLPPFEPMKDSHIPRYDPKATRNLDDSPGSERLSDFEANKQLRRLEPKFNKCIATAAQYSDKDIGSGSITFLIGIKPNGKVSGVNVKAPSNLRVFGIVPCLRNAVYRHRFPTWDGPPMGVDYSFDVG